MLLPEFKPQKHNSNANKKEKDSGKVLNICASNWRMIAKNNEQRLKSLHLTKNKRVCRGMGDSSEDGCEVRIGLCLICGCKIKKFYMGKDYVLLSYAYVLDEYYFD